MRLRVACGVSKGMANSRRGEGGVHFCNLGSLSLYQRFDIRTCSAGGNVLRATPMIAPSGFAAAPRPYAISLRAGSKMLKFSNCISPAMQRSSCSHHFMSPCCLAPGARNADPLIRLFSYSGNFACCRVLERAKPLWRSGRCVEPWRMESLVLQVRVFRHAPLSQLQLDG